MPITAFNSFTDGLEATRARGKSRWRHISRQKPQLIETELC